MEFGILKKSDGTTEKIQIAGTWKCVFDGKTHDDIVFRDYRYSFKCNCRKPHTAIMTNTLIAPAKGFVRIGSSADWYFEFKVNGVIAKSTMDKGNEIAEHRRSVHVFEFPVVKGKNKIEIKLRNGISSMMLMIGPELKPLTVLRDVSMSEAREAFERFCKTSCRNLTPKRKKDMQTLQSTLAKVPGKELHESEGLPANFWYENAFRKVLEELKTEKVEGKKVVFWLVYNMGIIVKTAKAAFAIDLYHKLAPMAEPYLDFCMVTHNHSDHCDLNFIKAFQRKGFLQAKPILSSFLPSPNYSKYPTTWKFGDITIHTGETDHNNILKNFMTPYEIICGDDPESCVIYHAGDSWDPKQFKPTRPVDLMFIHLAPVGLGGWHMAEETAKVIQPKNLFLCHMLEVGHGFGNGRWTVEQAVQEARRVKAPVRAMIPFWGEKFIWDPAKDR